MNNHDQYSDPIASDDKWDREGTEITTAQDLIDQVSAIIDEMVGMDNEKPGSAS